MAAFFSHLFAVDQYMPHGMCLLWQPGLMALHIVSDALIALSYYSIPLALLYFASQRKDTPFHGVILPFSIFILACGTTHIMAIVTLWQPLYGLDGLIKAATAAVSLTTAIALWRFMPAALRVPSQVQLVATNRALTHASVKRSLAEAALVKSESKFRNLFEGSAIGMAIVSPAGVIFEANRAFCAFLGYPEAELAGMTLSDITHPDHWPKTAQSVAALIAGKIASFRLEKRFVHRDASVEKWGEATVSLIRDSRGEPEYFIAQAIDITERKRADAALAESETRLRTMFQDCALGMSISNPSGEFIETNAAFRDFIGYSEEELSAKTVRDITYEEDRGKCSEEIDDCLTGWRTSFRTEKRFMHKSGEPKWAETHVALFRDAQGKPDYFFAQVLDIHGRKRAEEAIRRSEAEIRSFVEAAPYGIFRASEARDAFLSVNPALVTMLGYDRAADVRALRLSSGLYADAGGFERFLTKLDGTESFVAMETQWMHRDGKLLTVKVRARRLRDPRAGYVIEGVAENVTDRRALRAQLLQAQKMEAVGRLTGGMAHDFNNLLCVIVGNLEMLGAKTTDRKQAKDLLQRALRAAMNGADLTQRLLAFSRRQPLRPEVVYLHKLIGDFSGLLRHTLGESIALTIRTGPGLWPCLVDHNQLETALLNLAVNARDAMPNGGRISIGIENVALGAGGGNGNGNGDDVAAHGDYLKLSVADEGEGMAEEVQQRAFEPFFTTKSETGGSGLGLSMVYGFIKQSGGHVTIDSKLGEGTTVSLYLPRSDADAKPSADARAAEGPAPLALTGSVLVVEDRADVRTMACRMLEEFGFNVLAAGNAKRALTILDRIGDLQLLFTDVVLPGKMNGPDLAKEAVRRHPKLKVLFTSGFVADSKMYDDSTGAGSHLLTKPYRKEDMARMLQLVLSK